MCPYLYLQSLVTKQYRLKILFFKQYGLAYISYALGGPKKTVGWMMAIASKSASVFSIC